MCWMPWVSLWGLIRICYSGGYWERRIRSAAPLWENRAIKHRYSVEKDAKMSRPTKFFLYMGVGIAIGTVIGIWIRPDATEMWLRHAAIGEVGIGILCLAANRLK